MRNLLTAILSLFIVQLSIAQSISTSAITPLGNFYKGDNFTLNYILGETFNSFITNENFSIAQGVLQIIVSDVRSSNELYNSLTTVYPNPVENNLVIDFDGNLKQMSYRLFDINGNLYSNGYFNKGISNIDVNNLPKGHYALSVFEKDELYKTFKIIKQ